MNGSLSQMIVHSSQVRTQGAAFNTGGGGERVEGGQWLKNKNTTPFACTTKSTLTLEYLNEIQGYIWYTQIQMFFIKAVFLWHLLKMFVSEAWKKIKLPFQGLKNIQSLLLSPKKFQLP